MKTPLKAVERIKATSRDKEDAERYRAIRDRALISGAITLKAQADAKAFDSMVDKVLRG